MVSRREQVAAEAERIRESCEFSSVQHFIGAKWYRRTHFVLGVSTTLLATFSTGTVFYEGPTGLTASLGLATAILAGLMTFLNPKDAAALHHRKGVAYQRLVADARMLINLKAPHGDEDDLEGKVQSFNERKYDLDAKVPPVPSGLFYTLARRAIARGETRFHVDGGKPS